MRNKKLKATIRSAFVNRDGRLRNGWWILIFIGFIALTRFVYRPVTHGLKDLGVAQPWLEPAAFIFTLLATWACTRLRKQSLSSVGYVLDRRWFKEIAWGTLFGMGSIFVIAGLIWAAGGVRFELDPSRSVSALGMGFYVFLFTALFEENLNRGFIFQRLLDGTGVWIAQIAIAVLFAAGHLGNPGMEGSTEIWAMIDTALGAVLLGLAYLRTRSLALPIGMHLGWNWAQGNILGFGVSGLTQAGWFHPVFQGKAEWLSGGSFGPESSVFAVVVDLIVIGVLWKWKGSVPASASATHPVRSDSGQATRGDIEASLARA